MSIGTRFAVLACDNIDAADRGRLVNRLGAGRELLAIDDAEMQAFAGNVLELGTWDEYLGDMRILVVSATAHARSRRASTHGCTPRWMPCSEFRSTSSSGTGVAASVVCSRKFSCAESFASPWISFSR
jgi:hypothetical protein